MISTVLGVDIGRSQLSAAPVDTDEGEIVDWPASVPTPSPTTPGAVVAAIGCLADRFTWAGSIGVAFPGVVERGIVRTATGLDPSWIGVDLAASVADDLGAPVAAVNDADAAGLAEVRFGAAYGHPGVVVVVTIGAGIGTGVFHDGMLVPNSELGHLPVHGHRMDELVTARPEGASVSWEAWAHELSQYLELLEQLLWPSLIVIGGAASADFDRFGPHLRARTTVVPAMVADHGAVVGAALVGRSAHADLGTVLR